MRTSERYRCVREMILDALAPLSMLPVGVVTAVYMGT